MFSAETYANSGGRGGSIGQIALSHVRRAAVFASSSQPILDATANASRTLSSRG